MKIVLVLDGLDCTGILCLVSFVCIPFFYLAVVCSLPLPYFFCIGADLMAPVMIRIAWF